MNSAQQRRHERQSSSASSSSSSVQIESSEVPDVRAAFEQRRVRNITAIIIRNLRGIKATKLAVDGKIPRPTAPKRSLSITSNASGHTLRRSASNRTLRPSARRRASSIGSDFIAEQEDSSETALRSSLERQNPQFLAWDLNALKPALSERMLRAHVTLRDASTDRLIYRTPVSSQGATHHAWGLAPDSESDYDGIDLRGLHDDVGLKGKVRMALWTHTGEEEDDEEDQSRQSSSKVWEEEVDLSKLRPILDNDLNKLDSSLAGNTIIIGLKHPISAMLPPEIDDDDSEERQYPKFKDRKGKGSMVQYYIVSPLSEVSADRATYSKALQRKWLKQGRVIRAYEIDDVLRILQMQSQHAELLSEVDQLQGRIDSSFNGTQEPLTRSLAFREKREALDILITQRDSAREQVKERMRLLKKRQEALSRERARLEVAKRLLLNDRSYFDELHGKMVQLAKLRDRIEARIFSRRVTLLRQVERIYPIELLDGAELLFNIVEVPLATPRETKDDRGWKEKSVQKYNSDDDTVSSALGMVGQMVALISAYTDTPLHYPIATAGSRSVIQDAISAMSGPRTFPLFAKGAEQYRFEYGHFLLNKDIEQLMNNAGITILDIRNTLPNLKNLIVTLTASSKRSSKLSRQNHVGEQMISLHAGLVKGGGKEQDRSSIGIGHPHTEGGHAEDVQLGYGSIVGRDGTLSEAPASRLTSRWGMSLLGWGNVKETLDDAKRNGDDRTPLSNDIPTVRKLGKGR